MTVSEIQSLPIHFHLLSVAPESITIKGHLKWHHLRKVLQKQLHWHDLHLQSWNHDLLIEGTICRS